MIKKLFFFIACGILISSCAPTTSSNVGGGQIVPQGGGQQYAYSNYVLINNRALLRDLQITDIKSKMVNDLMEVQVQVMNKRSKTLSFVYSFHWFDASGFEVVGVGEHWTPTVINGNEVKSLIGVAPTPEATQFKVQIRKSR